MGMGMTSSGPDLNSVLYFDAHFSFIINEFKDLRKGWGLGKQGDRRGGVPCFATVVDAIQQAHFFCAGLNLTWIIQKQGGNSFSSSFLALVHAMQFDGWRVVSCWRKRLWWLYPSLCQMAGATGGIHGNFKPFLLQWQWIRSIWACTKNLVPLQSPTWSDLFCLLQEQTLGLKYSLAPKIW